MKINGLKILIIFSLFLFSANQVDAACSWTKKETVFNFGAPTTSGGCISPKTEDLEINCTGIKPVYMDTATSVCCCDKGEAAVTNEPIERTQARADAANTAKGYVCTWTIPKTTTTQSEMPTIQLSCPSPTSACDECTGTKPGYLCCKHTTVAPGPKFILPDYVFQIPIGTLTGLKMVDCSSGTCDIPFLSEYILAVYRYGLSIAGVLGVLMLMAAGLLWLVSGGDSGKIGQAKKMIFGSVFGLLLLVGLSLFLSFINPDLAVTKIISLPSIEKIEITPEVDTDIGTFGGKTIYKAGCDASRTKDYSVCRAYGNLKPEKMSTVAGIKGNVQVDTAFYQRYLDAMKCVKGKNGGKEIFGINEGFRDAATQIKYWENNPGGSAPPCCSNHSYGEAMDINRLDRVPMSWAYNDSSGLTACMNALGLKAEIHKPTTKYPQAEAWHWSLTGH